MTPNARLAAAMQRLDASIAAKRAQAAENRARAPICAAFVESMRAEFGDVTVTCVKERDVVIGKPDERPAVDSGDVTVYEEDGSRTAVARWTHLKSYARAEATP